MRLTGSDPASQNVAIWGERPMCQGILAEEGSVEQKKLMTRASQDLQGTARILTATSQELRGEAKALMERAAELKERFMRAKDLYETAQRIFRQSCQDFARSQQLIGLMFACWTLQQGNSKS
jgi:hypothetical protein